MTLHAVTQKIVDQLDHCTIQEGKPRRLSLTGSDVTSILKVDPLFEKNLDICLCPLNPNATCSSILAKWKEHAVQVLSSLPTDQQMILTEKFGDFRLKCSFTGQEMCEILRSLIERRGNT